MYSTCLFCNRPLGGNEMVEDFPVGRRLAFDGAKGRLWVVCKKCERWNLTPLEERWEAIETCERLFRDARLRMSTDNVGLAKLLEGLELVRIGEPLRPEFAAWRYGDQFGRRRKRAIMWAGAGVAAFGALAVGASAAGISIGAFAGMPNAIINARIRVKVKTEDGRTLTIRKTEMDRARLLHASDATEWTLAVKHSKGNDVFVGTEAMRVAGLFLPKMNYMAGSKKVVSNAVEQIEQVGDPEAYIATIPGEIALVDERKRVGAKKTGMLSRLPTPTKLALEMALHEEQEQRALAGELLDIEAAWREAEEVAHIADNLLVPPEVEAFVERHKRRSDEVDS